MVMMDRNGEELKRNGTDLTGGCHRAGRCGIVDGLSIVPGVWLWNLNVYACWEGRGLAAPLRLLLGSGYNCCMSTCPDSHMFLFLVSVLHGGILLLFRLNTVSDVGDGMDVRTDVGRTC